MTRLYAVFSSHALLPSPFRGSSLSARISEVRRRFSNNLHNFCCAHVLPLIRRTGAMLVAICMPGFRKRWFLFTFGVLADGNTCRFLCPLYKGRSWRLSLEWVLIAFHQTLTDDQTGIAIGIALHA